jgi:hypothetical protein
MKKLIIGLLALAPLLCAAAQKTYYLPNQVHNNEAQQFVSHHKEGRFGSYLTMTVNFSPLKTLFEQLPGLLKNRGEAHVTVVTPVEFYQVLRSKVTMAQIDKIAKQQQIQATKFETVCLGRGQKKGKDQGKTKVESTYFVVINAEGLLNIRRKVHALFVKQGGQAEAFDPNHYYPHITVGFSSKDLHQSDGVIKDRTACFAKFKSEKADIKSAF